MNNTLHAYIPCIIVVLNLWLITVDNKEGHSDIQFWFQLSFRYAPHTVILVRCQEAQTGLWLWLYLHASLEWQTLTKKAMIIVLWCLHNYGFPRNSTNAKPNADADLMHFIANLECNGKNDDWFGLGAENDCNDQQSPSSVLKNVIAIIWRDWLNKSNYWADNLISSHKCLEVLV